MCFEWLGFDLVLFVILWVVWFAWLPVVWVLVWDVCLVAGCCFD